MARTRKVKVNSVYFYVPVLLDQMYAGTRLGVRIELGRDVRVVNMHGCPPANTMGHCYVQDAGTGKFLGLVCCNSLLTRDEYRQYLLAKMAERCPQA
jgi:hypothetical protein